MRKKTFLTLLSSLAAVVFTAIIVIGCGSVDKRTETRSPSQVVLQGYIDRYENTYYTAPNTLSKSVLKQLYLDSIISYLKDTLNYRMQNFHVEVKEIAITDVSNVKAFRATFIDNQANEYWMEFDYKPGQDTALENNPAYRLLKGIKENTDTVLSFFWMGDLQWRTTRDDRIRVQVVPFPANFNFDSSQKANTRDK